MKQEMFPYSILYVEDEQSVRENYTLYLQRFFRKVFSVESAEKAQDIIRREDIDILLMDISLPGQNGLDFVENLRQSNPYVRVIVLTAHSDVAWLLQAVQLKLTTYLLKPVERVKLKEALEKAIEEIQRYEIVSKEIVTLANGLQWDMQTQSFVDATIKLTTNETILLSYLFANRKSIVPSDDICYEIWNEGLDAKAAALKTLVKKLRKKLPDNSIENIYAQGYRVCV